MQNADMRKFKVAQKVTNHWFIKNKMKRNID